MKNLQNQYPIINLNSIYNDIKYLYKKDGFLTASFFNEHKNTLSNIIKYSRDLLPTGKIEKVYLLTEDFIWYSENPHNLNSIDVDSTLLLIEEIRDDFSCSYIKVW